SRANHPDRGHDHEHARDDHHHRRDNHDDSGHDHEHGRDYHHHSRDNHDDSGHHHDDGGDDHHHDDEHDHDEHNHHHHEHDHDEHNHHHHEHDHDEHDHHHHHHDDHEHDAVQLRGRGAVAGDVHDRGRLGHLRPPRLGHERELLVAQLRRALLRRRGRGGATALHRPRPGEDVQQGGVHGDDSHPERDLAHRGRRQPLLGRVESPQRLHDGRRLPGRHVQVPAVHERGLPVRPAAADPEPLPPGRGHQQLRHQLDHGQCRGDGRLQHRLHDGPERPAEFRHLP